MSQVSSSNRAAEADQAIQDLLAALVQSKQFLGFQYASWCIRSPSIETNIALAGMAQEELGHAIVADGLLGDDAQRGVADKDTIITWDRWAQAGSASFTMIDDWPRMIVTCLAREAATTAALEALKEAPDSQLASRARKMVQEEQFHLVFGVETARGFAALPGKTGKSLAEDYQRALADAEAELGAEKTLARLTALGALPARALEARTQFLQSMTRRLDDAWG